MRLAVSLLAAAIALTLASALLISCAGPTGSAGDDARLLDSLPPVIEWITPAAGDTVDTLVTLSVRATDDRGVYRVAFYIAGFEFDPQLADSAGGIYRYEWNARRYPEGPYPLTAMVWDLSRQIGSTPTLLVQVRH